MHPADLLMRIRYRQFDIYTEKLKTMSIVLDLETKTAGYLNLESGCVKYAVNYMRNALLSGVEWTN